MPLTCFAHFTCLSRQKQPKRLANSTDLSMRQKKMPYMNFLFEKKRREKERFLGNVPEVNIMISHKETTPKNNNFPQSSGARAQHTRQQSVNHTHQWEWFTFIQICSSLHRHPKNRSHNINIDNLAPLITSFPPLDQQVQHAHTGGKRSTSAKQDQ